MNIQILALAFLATAAVGGIAWVFLYPMLSGERKAESRRASIARADAPAAKQSEKSQRSRREQVETSLKDLEARRQQEKSVPLSVRISQAGLNWTPQKFWIVSAVVGGALFAAAMFVGGGLLGAATDEHGNREQHARHDGGRDPEFLRRPVQPRLRQADAERNALLLLTSGLEILQRSLDLFTARALALLGLLGHGRVGARDRGAAAFRLPLPGQQRIEEHPGDAADSGGGEEGEGEDLHVHGGADLLTSAAPLRPRRARRQGASPRRNSERVPRTSDGRCRSSDAAR